MRQNAKAIPAALPALLATLLVGLFVAACQERPRKEAGTAQADSVAALLKRQTQVLMDAVASGESEVWRRYLHENVVYLDENGNPIPDRARLAGNTLLWSRDGITYRLEADIDKEAALRIARSVS